MGHESAANISHPLALDDDDERLLTMLAASLENGTSALDDFFHWYVIGGISTGMCVNVGCLVAMTLNFRRLCFRPHLFAVVVSNSVYLGMLAIHVWNEEFHIDYLSDNICRASLYFGEVFGQLPGFFMLSVSLEQCLSIWRNPYARVRTRERRQLATVGMITLLSLAFNAWIPVVATARRDERGATCSLGHERFHFVPVLEVAKVLFLDCFRFLVILVCHAGLIYKLRKTFRPPEAAKKVGSSGHLANVQIVVDVEPTQLAERNDVSSSSGSLSSQLYSGKVSALLQLASRGEAASCPNKDLSMRRLPIKTVETRRKSTFQLVLVVTLIIACNLPKNIFEVVEKLANLHAESASIESENQVTGGSGILYLFYVSYTLFLGQFFVIALYVRLSMFWTAPERQRTANSNSHSTTQPPLKRKRSTTLYGEGSRGPMSDVFVQTSLL